MPHFDFVKIMDFEKPEMFPELPAIAERLGVSKLKPGERASVVLSMKNGDGYSVFALLNAFLDRMDKSMKDE